METDSTSIPYRPLPPICTVAKAEPELKKLAVEKPRFIGVCKMAMPLRGQDESCDERAVAFWCVLGARVPVCETHAHLLASAGKVIEL